MSNIQLLPQFDGDNCSFSTCANSWWLDIIYFTQPGFGAPVQVPGCSITSGQNVIPVPDTSMLFPGMTISSLTAGIPFGAFIGVVSPASITMVTNAGATLNASSSNVDVTLNFNPPPLDLTGISFICNWRRRQRRWGGSRFGWDGEQVFLTCQTADTTLIAGGPLGTLQFNVPDFFLGRIPPGIYFMDIVAIDAIYRVNLFQKGPCQIFHTGGVSDPSLFLTTAQVGSGSGD